MARQMNLVSSVTITHQNAVTLSSREFQPNIFLNLKCSALSVFSLVKSCDNYLSSFSSGIKARVMLICFWKISFTADKYSQNTIYNYNNKRYLYFCSSPIWLGKTTGQNKWIWKALGSGTGTCCRGILHTAGREEYCGIQNYLYFDLVAICIQ